MRSRSRIVRAATSVALAELTAIHALMWDYTPARALFALISGVFTCLGVYYGLLSLNARD